MLEEFLTGEDFAKRVARCEQYAAAHPTAYRRRVIAMAWLGYWLVPVIMAVLLALPVFVFWLIFTGEWPLVKKIIYGVMWGFYAFGIIQMAQALFVPYRPVEGLDVTEADAPELFSVIEEAREKLDAPKLDRVVLTDDLNAAAAQAPTRSFMAKITNELIVGLPLLEALERDELQGVIAHELGHFSGAHGRDGFVVGRTTRAWEIALATSQTYGGWTAFVPLGVAKWFVPRFMAYSFALRCGNEFFADRASVEVVGAEAAGRALIRSQLAGVHAGDVKDKYLHEALHSAYAPKEPLGHLYSDLANASANPKAHGCIMLALHAESDPLDTHPGLKARLEAIGASCEVPASVQRPAIQL
ncbi:MAG: M48 family metallopeptidase, partial [Hyphomicrobiales bacterium]|nr:M48 family metallopeptidase [Hyphomicrobiales bacterium]